MIWLLTRLVVWPVKGLELGFKTGRLVGYRRIIVFGLGVAVGLLVAPTTGVRRVARIEGDMTNDPVPRNLRSGVKMWWISRRWGNDARWSADIEGDDRQRHVSDGALHHRDLTVMHLDAVRRSARSRPADRRAGQPGDDEEERTALTRRTSCRTTGR